VTHPLVRGSVTVAEADGSAAEDVLAMIQAGFGARELLDPPSTATDETAASVASALEEHGGLLATAEHGPVGALLFEPVDGRLGLRRVSVHPDAQGAGVARSLVAAAERVARERGYDGLQLAARVELPRTIHFWAHLGYTEIGRDGVFLTLGKELPVELTAATGEDTRAYGERLGRTLRAGDLVILTGDLGAGKTTFTQGLGAGLGVRAGVTSPTFVISRVHPSECGGPALVHVDAYRLGGIDELDDLDLDTSLDGTVTVVEWGHGVAEGLAEAYLEIAITRARGGDGADETRHLVFTPVGARWIGSGLRSALA